MAISGSINFISASLTGSENIHVDFVGLNTLIVDVVSGASNNLGIPASLDASEYYNSAIEAQGDPTNPNQLNSLLLNRNGPYQHPSWKQIRGSEHTLSRHLRMNNTMSVDLNMPDPLEREKIKKNNRARIENYNTRQEAIQYEEDHEYDDGPTDRVWKKVVVSSVKHEDKPSLPQNLKQFYFPVLTTKHKPLVYSVTDGDNNYKVRFSLMNQMMDFSSEDMNDQLRFASGDLVTGSLEKVNFKSSNFQSYELLKIAKKTNGHGFIYSERIYPREVNSYRHYKLKRLDFEQVSGLGPNGYDKDLPRLFWKNTQGGGSSLATSDGSSRLRTDGTALNTLSIQQNTNFPEGYNAATSTSARQLISGTLNFVSAAYNGHAAVDGHSFQTSSFSKNVTTNSLDVGLQGLVVEYINNGVVINRYQTDSLHLPVPGHSGHVSAAFFQLDSYQPYQPSLLSSWPLDTRNDIYSKPPYLTSSIGGKGLQIGLTPHRNNNIIDSSLTHEGLLKLSGSSPNLTSSIINTVINLLTASAGELAYSTKPTIFFWRNANTHSTSSMSFAVGASKTVNELFQEDVFGAGKPVEKFELQDAQGNRVGFAFHSGSATDTTQDGSTIIATGSTVVKIGIGALTDNASSVTTLLRRVESAVNSTNSAANGLFLNVSASYETGPSSEKVLVFHQKTFGTGGTIHTVTSSGPGDLKIATPKHQLRNVTIYAGNRSGGSSDTIARFKGPENGTVASLKDDAIMGYKTPTASLQYNRHTFPYNTPFYATNRVRGREPFYNSYSDFIGSDIEKLGRDYTIFSEYKFSENMNFYSVNYSGMYNKDNNLYGIGGNNDFEANKIIRKFSVGGTLTPANGGGGIKADSFENIGASPTASAGTEEYEKSATRYKYDDLKGVQVSEQGANVRTYLSDKDSVEYDNKYGITDTTINFSHLLAISGDDSFQDAENTIPKKINFKCDVFKKLLPYNGFYPVTRTTQIGQAFINEITGAEGYNGKMDQVPEGQTTQDVNSGPAYAQAFLEPFMAPGILFNSIKSGIAVGYPIYSQKPKYFYSSDFTSPVDGTTHGVQDDALETTFHGGLYMMGASRCIPSILTSKPDKTLPFDVLHNKNIFIKELCLQNADPAKGEVGERPYIHLVSDFVDLDRASMTSLTASPPHKIRSGSIQIANPHTQAPSKEGMAALDNGKYFSMINNFLSEVMEFFLASDNTTQTKLPVFVGGHDGKDISLQQGKEYSMELSLYSGKHQVMCEGPRNAGIGNVAGALTRTGDQSGYFMRNSSMRGYIYGPPTEIVPMLDRSSGFEWSNEISNFKDCVIEANDDDIYLAANLQDPAYHAYTPPYFYGKSSCVFRFTQQTTVDEATEDIRSKVLSSIDGTSFFVEEYLRPFSGSSAVHRFRVDDDSLHVIIPNTGSISNGSTLRMDIGKSVDFSGVTIPIEKNDIIKQAWAIAPKWICPVLDFSSSYSAVRNKVRTYKANNEQLDITYEIETVNNTFHDTTTGRGLWGGYGTDPYDVALMKKVYEAEGIEESKYNFYNNNKGLYLQMADFSISSNTESDIPADTTFLTDIETDTYFSTIDQTVINEADSLTDELGFRKDALEVGKLAETKEINEAIALIPYFENEISIKAKHTWKALNTGHDSHHIYQTREIIPGKHFLPIHEGLFKNILSIYVQDKTMSYSEQEKNSLFTTLADEFSNNVASSVTNPAGGQDITTLKKAYLESARKEAAATDVYKLIEKISAHGKNNGFVLPPEFDFVHNSNVLPFQMMVIPFSDTLDKQDLADIYQGIMPDSSLHLEKDHQSLEVNPNKKLEFHELYMPGTEVFSNNQNNQVTTKVSDLYRDLDLANFLSASPVVADKINDYIVQGDSVIPFKTAREFYKNLRFMVFKVKQRSKKDFSNYRRSQIIKATKNTLLNKSSDYKIFETADVLQDKFKTSADVYGANWPYDYFSLIQTGKIDIEIEVDG
jgi:hypothetical protein